MSMKLVEVVSVLISTVSHTRSRGSLSSQNREMGQQPKSPTLRHSSLEQRGTQHGQNVETHAMKNTVSEASHHPLSSDREIPLDGLPVKKSKCVTVSISTS